ncbi:MAG TPA: histidine phosphatase family protein [Candidatus Saccharimonadales bacterium]
MKHLYYVRHGQSRANVERVYAGLLDTPLTDLGVKQAEAAARQAKHLGIGHIISSPLSRAHETAKIIARAIDYPAEEIELSGLLVERNFGSAAGRSWDDTIDLDSLSDAETMNAVAKRARQAYEYIRTLPYDTILVVGHGTFWQKFYMTIYPGTAVTGADEPKNAEMVQLL